MDGKLSDIIGRFKELQDARKRLAKGKKKSRKGNARVQARGTPQRVKAQTLGKKPEAGHRNRNERGKKDEA